MTLLKKTSVYFFSNMLNALMPFLLLPILTRYMSPSEYGQVAMFQMLLTGIGTFIGLNSVSSANRKFYDDTNHNSLKIFNGVCIQLLVFSSFVILTIFFIFYKEISDFLSIKVSWIIASIFISVSIFILNLRLGQWQIRGKAKWFGIVQVGSSIVNLLLSLLFVVVFMLGGEGRVDAQIISSIIAAIISLVWLYKDNLLKVFIWKPDYIKEALSFSIPLIPHTFGVFLITAADRFVINDKIGLSSAGIYMVAVQLSSAMAIVFDSINKAYVPWLFERLKRDNQEEKKSIVINTYIYFVGVIILSIFAFYSAPFFTILIAGDKYKAAGDIVGWLCLGQGFGGMYLMVTNYIFYAKKTGKLASVTISTGLINILLLFILIDSFGLIGAAFSFVICKFLQFMLTWIISYKCVYMPWFKVNYN